LNGDSAAALGSWTHATSGKASIFSTMHIGNPKPDSTLSTYYDTGKSFADCWAMANTKIDDTTNKAIFSGLFSWCRSIVAAGVTNGFDLDIDGDGDKDNAL